MRYEAEFWKLSALAWIIAVELLQALVWFVGTGPQTRTLSDFSGIYTGIFAVESIYALSWIIWPRGSKARQEAVF